MADAFKLVSLNVKGISNFLKRRTMFTWCRKRKADIMFLQETHSTEKTDTQWKNEWGVEIIRCHGSSNSRGVAILIKNGLDCTIHQKILDPLGRYIILKADIKDKIYVIINVYAPNKDKDLIIFFNNLFVTLQKENLDSEDNIIIGGDFNCPLNVEVDKKEAYLFNENQLQLVLIVCKINLIWLIYGELKTQTQKVSLGVKNPQESFVVLTIG